MTVISVVDMADRMQLWCPPQMSSEPRPKHQTKAMPPISGHRATAVACHEYCPCSTNPSHEEAVKCGVTTMLSSQVSDRPTKLSQIHKMGSVRSKLTGLATGG